MIEEQNNSFMNLRKKNYGSFVFRRRLSLKDILGTEKENDENDENGNGNGNLSNFIILLYLFYRIYLSRNN